MPEARAFCARRAISSSTFLPTIIIKSASSSMITTTNGKLVRSSTSSATTPGTPCAIFCHADRVLDRLAAIRGILHLAVETADVAHAERRHELITPLHFGDAPAQRIRRLLHVGDHRRQQVRDALVDRELEHLRIDHDHAHVLGRRLVHQAQHHGVDADRFARARRAGDQAGAACARDPPPPARRRYPCRAQARAASPLRRRAST